MSRDTFTARVKCTNVDCKHHLVLVSVEFLRSAHVVVFGTPLCGNCGNICKVVSPAFLRGSTAAP